MSLIIFLDLMWIVFLMAQGRRLSSRTEWWGGGPMELRCDPSCTVGWFWVWLSVNIGDDYVACIRIWDWVWLIFCVSVFTIG